ncbi:hypothetical protein VAPA_1c10720 [Variovorax paradoxus B4]|uniref:Uncharacterized protein n=1 Tax=Variovorax paradoxus B4 TaxID=1246301 RepID=T1X7R3_VARPD|nr:hypothetical protein VAPA_1c10720 [Variovorax paradoxus B4]
MIGADGSVHSTELTAGLFQIFSDCWKLDDLEGLALDRAGFVHAITSHSRDDDDDDDDDGDEGSRVADPQVVDGLKRALTAKHPERASAARIRDVKTGGGLNIEALEISPRAQSHTGRSCKALLG